MREHPRVVSIAHVERLPQPRRAHVVAEPPGARAVLEKVDVLVHVLARRPGLAAVGRAAAAEAAQRVALRLAGVIDENRARRRPRGPARGA